MESTRKMAINFDYNYPEMARDAGFKLRQYKDGPLDWRRIGSLEVDRILREQSIEQIDGVLDHLSEAPLGTILETNILDSGIAKYFILSQFSIQYLLFCRKLLDETVRDLRESHAESQMELAKLKKSLAEANNEILQLHKKITQIEAIHEVVYPCHLCTKSFVSNESLNIHIARKHPGKGAATTEHRHADSSGSTQKERERDLNLINTIKLELEIKQLKERLNNAEKEIRERSTSNNSKRTTPREQEEMKRDVRNIGIQSNLMESKEKDDTIADDIDESALNDRKGELIKLQEKIKHFEEWKEMQSTNNEESIAEIHTKLAAIARVVENSRTLDAKTMQRNGSSSVENFEQILTQRVAEIGKASAEKLEETVSNLEASYKEKLNEMEKELKQKHAESTQRILENASKKQNLFVSETRAKRSTSSSDVGMQEIVHEINEETTNNDTYDIEDFKEQGDMRQEELTTKRNSNERISEKPQNRKIEKTPVSTESNHTFVKAPEIKSQIIEVTKSPLVVEPSEATDISESLSEGRASESSEIISVEATRQKIPRITQQKDEIKKETAVKAKKDEKKPKAQPKVKVFTRKDAKKLANKRLVDIGFGMNTRTVSNVTMKHISTTMLERRNKLKQKYPNFYATRNKIKKFVDKLCSAKLPENAEAMLKSTQILQPPTEATKEKVYDEMSSDAESTDASEAPVEASTPLQLSQDKNAFKQRLERILASPMRRPADQRHMTKAEVLTVPPRRMNMQPIPMPRKRVMFNTFDDTKTSENSIDSDIEQDFESTYKERDKRILESSFGSLL